MHGHNQRGKRPSNYGKPMSEEQKEKLRKNHADVSGENNPMFGTHRVHSEETIEKMRESHIGDKNAFWIDGLGNERGSATHRGLNFYPLNKKTKIANSPHHIDDDVVIFIPREMHKKYYHRRDKPETMKKLNELAFEFYTIQWFEEHNIKDW